MQHDLCSESSWEAECVQIADLRWCEEDGSGAEHLREGDVDAYEPREIAP